MKRAAPDILMAGGYQPDTIVLAKDIYRANYKGKVLGYAYAVNDQFIAGVGKEVAEGTYAMEPIPDANSTAYARLASKLKRDSLDIYTCHGYDEANLAVLAIAAAKQATGTAIRDHMRVVGDPQRRKGGQRGGRHEGAGRGQGDQLPGRFRPVQVRAQRRFDGEHLPLLHRQGRQAGPRADAVMQGGRDKPGHDRCCSMPPFPSHLQGWGEGEGETGGWAGGVPLCRPPSPQPSPASGRGDEMGATFTMTGR